MSYLSEGGYLVIDDSNIDAFIAMDQSDEKFPIGKDFHSHLVTSFDDWEQKMRKMGWKPDSESGSGMER
ncbi:MAG: hypothetical protein J6575_01450 [Bifidobacterium sp.]|nr:hypothetical protein [Bifidobacterium sp.]